MTPALRCVSPPMRHRQHASTRKKAARPKTLHGGGTREPTYEGVREISRSAGELRKLQPRCSRGPETIALCCLLRCVGRRPSSNSRCDEQRRRDDGKHSVNLSRLRKTTRVIGSPSVAAGQAMLVIVTDDFRSTMQPEYLLVPAAIPHSGDVVPSRVLHLTFAH